MHHPWIFFYFFIVQNVLGIKLSEKSLQPEAENVFFVATKQRDPTHTGESNLTPHHIYYLGPREVNHHLDFRFLPVGRQVLSKNIENGSSHEKYLQEYEPNILKSPNVSTSKIQVTEFKPYFKSNSTETKVFQQKFKSSATTPKFLKDQDKLLQAKDIPQPHAFQVLIEPQQKKILSNLIKVNQNNYLQTSNNSQQNKIGPRDYEAETAVYITHNLQDLINSNNNNYKFSSQNSKENQSDEQKKLPRLKVPQENEIRFLVNVPPLPVKNNKGNLLSDTENKSKQNISSSLDKNSQFDVFLSILQETKKLPKNLTSDNLNSGIKTLALILQRLQEEKKTGETRPKQTFPDKITPKTSPDNMKLNLDNYRKTQTFPQLSETSTPGKPGTDYPIYASIPNTKFDCSTQRYKGFFADPETNCQVWHYCDLNGGQASFLCPNGTIFSQAALTCDWWFNVKCSSTSQLYVLNERLYKYILPFAPSFPEDYSGPIVDKYLMAKFKEKHTN